MQPVIYDCMPAMADVFSGAIPRPVVLKPGRDVAKWARSTASILRLADRWGIDAATVKPAQSTDDELADFLSAVLGRLWPT